jgi:tripartite motif-containing protein 71
MKFDNAGRVVSEWGSAYTEDGQFAEPGSIMIDPSGHVVVADVGNSRIQKFTPEGRFVSRWGGEAWFGVVGLATDASGSLYVANWEPNDVQKYDADGKLIGRWGGTGGGGGLPWYASAIAVGPSGNVYVVDMSNNRVQKFTGDGKFLAKWGTEGTEDGQFRKPVFIAVDDSGNVWVGDQLGDTTHRMQKFDDNGKVLATWTRRILRPLATNYRGVVAVDSSGSSYYPFENRIEKYDAAGNLISHYGQKQFSEDELGQAWGACVDQADSLYVTGPANPGAPSIIASGSIRKFDAEGKYVTQWTGGNTEGAKRFPNGRITMDQAGNMYALCWGSPLIRKLSSNGRLAAEFPIAVSREGRFTELGGVTVDGSGKVEAVDSVDVDCDSGIRILSIQEFDANGRFITVREVPTAATDKFKYPARIAVDGSGSKYVTDQGSHCVHKLDAQGKYIKTWGSKGTGEGQFDTPEGIAVDGSGHVYVCDRQNSRIQKFGSDGNFLAKWGKEGSGDGEFHFPAAVAVDQEGNLFVADSDNHRVQKFTAAGRFLTKWGEFGEAPGQFNVPLGIAVDREGNVYVSDSHNHRIQKFAPVAPR